MLANLHRLQGPIAAIVALAVVLPGLGASGLLDPWEMDRAAVARLVAGAPQVLVVDDDSSLLSRLDEAAGDAMALRRVPTSGDGAAATGLSRAPNELNERVHHAVIVDADAVLSGRKGDDGADLLASRLDALRANNRGTAIVLVSARPVGQLRRKLGEARARLLQASHRGQFTEHALPPADKAAALWPLMPSDELIATPERAAETLREAAPSPWTMVQHKAAGTSAQAPLLDTWLTAAAMRVMGPSEWSARLPGAVLLAATAWWTVACSAALFGTAGGWLALLVLVTMPLAIGGARIVTLHDSATLGVALVSLGMAMGAVSKGRWWWLAVLIGLDVLLLGRGLGGLSIGAAIVAAYAAATGDRRPAMLGVLAAALGGLALAAWVILANDTSPLLRAMRFTQVAFSGGLPDDRRDLAELISHLGFGLYPWGPVFLLGCGRMLFSADPDQAQRRRDIALLLGFGAPLLATAMLAPKFAHTALPVAAIAAVITAALLVDVLRGRVHGAVLALLVIVPALLLHREIGKDAGVMARWLAFDPPLGDDKAAYTWPQELAMHKGARRLVLLLTIGFALALARPVDAAKRLLAALQTRRATLWAMAVLAIAWVLDVLISAGTRLDVLLRAEAVRTGYNYDRVWTTIQMTRPEVIAGAATFVALLVGALLSDVGRRRGWGAGRLAALFSRISGLLGKDIIAAAALVGAAIGLLVNGGIVLVSIQRVGVGDVLTEGLTSAAFLVPALLLVLAALAQRAPTALGHRWEWLAADRDTVVSRLLATVGRGGWLLLVALAAVAIAGVGVGASQVAGTWTYGFLAACWGLALAVVLTIGGRVKADPGGWAAAALLAAIVVAAGVWAVLVGRLLLEPTGPGWRYVPRLLLLAPDSAVLLALVAGVGLNRWAVSNGTVAVARRGALWLAGLGQRPGPAVGLLGAAAALLLAGYAHGLLPGMSLHFSQKHLLARVEAAGGTVDSDGLPRTFKHAGGGRSSIQTNFYTRSMPTIADRDTVLDLLAGHDVGTRVSDYGDLGRSLDLAISGWRDDNDQDGDGKRDKPAWFGIAKKIDGLSLTAELPSTGAEGSKRPGWAKDQWKGARLHAADGHEIAILGNSADTLRLAAPTALIGGDVRRGAFSLDMNTGEGAHRSSSAERGARFVVLAKDRFSELNDAFRRKHQRHIPVLDARSSRLVLAASALPKGHEDGNWLRKAVVSEEELKKRPGLTRVSINWDDSMEMVAYHLQARSVRRSQKYVLTMYLKVHKAMQHSYKLFMHPHPLHRDLWPLDYKRETKATEKRCSGCFQTNHWRPGDIVVFPIEQEVPLGTNAGAQDVIVGWYDPLTDKRLQLISAEGPGVIKHRDNRVTVTKLQVR